MHFGMIFREMTQTGRCCCRVEATEACMATIDATARVADTARLGDDVEIGPHCLVGPEVELRDGVRLIAHVTVTGATTIGEATLVYPFASLGTPPQSVHYRGELRRAFRSLFLGDGELAIGLRGWRAHLPTIRWCKRSSRSSERGVNGRSCIRDESDDPDGLPGSLRFSAMRTANYFLYRSLTTVKPIPASHVHVFTLRNNT